MKMDQMQEAYKAFCGNVPYSRLTDFIDKLPRFLATKIVESFKVNITRFQEPFVWDAGSQVGVVAVLDGFVPQGWPKVKLAINISCSPVSCESGKVIKIAFFERENGCGFSIRDYADSFGWLGFTLDERDGRLRQYVSADEVFADVDGFISNIHKMVKDIEGLEQVFTRQKPR